MPFLQLTLDIGTADPSPLEDALFAAGAASVTLQDSADDPILEPAPGATPLWPTVTVKALFACDLPTHSILEVLERALGSVPEHRFEEIADRIWEREWLKDFKPMQFGKRLWVCPGGMLPSAELLPAANSQWPVCLLQLDPGLAFGTGTHPTTALCLDWIDAATLSGKNVIDYGCGSGILAIAALKLGARSATGVDIDAQSLLASRSNAQNNGVSEQLTLHDANANLAAADVLFANILAGPLNELAPKFAGLVVPGGSLVLSGILKDQASELARRYAAWFDMEVPVYREAWARLTGKRITQTLRLR